jgi:hypothetical protein
MAETKCWKCRGTKKVLLASTDSYMKYGPCDECSDIALLRKAHREAELAVIAGAKEAARRILRIHYGKRDYILPELWRLIDTVDALSKLEEIPGVRG